MDKRFTPLTPHEQLLKRQQMIDQLVANPEWSVDQVVRFIRAELHLTLPEMAKVCKVSKQTLQNIEQGQGNPTLETVDKILRPFGFRMGMMRIKVA
ncbi:MAG: helix-turn-helix transcriptional regulator [Gammaproteobacteria bacterium]|nr:helix-turn-helix transcriptional regulator [Gammaproteobacteria bacterium]